MQIGLPLLDSTILAKNGSIEILDASHSDLAGVEIAEALLANSTLTELHLQSCRLRDAQVRQLEAVLDHTTFKSSLKILNLVDNEQLEDEEGWLKVF